MTKIEAYLTDDGQMFQTKDKAQSHEIAIAANNLGGLGAEGFIALTKGDAHRDLIKSFRIIYNALPPCSSD